MSAERPDFLPTADEVESAARRLRGIIRPTPLRRSDALSAHFGGDVWLKEEQRQLTGSFKLRGAYNLLATLPRAAARAGVVASSAGNHGLGVAYAARALGITATVFVPADAPAVKRDGIAALGATVDGHAPDYDAAEHAARAFAERTGALFVGPHHDTALYAGQGTIAVELLEQCPDLRTVVVCVGGGGLLAGIGGYLREVAPHVTVIGAQTDATNAMAASLAAGRRVEIPSQPTIADALAGQIGEEGLPIGRWCADRVDAVPESVTADTVRWLATQGIVAEGGGAAATAWLRHHTSETLATPIVAIVSGGNIDPARHAALCAPGGAAIDG
jgi:threonine dehydratase